jgi:hypothetical protein
MTQRTEAPAAARALLGRRRVRLASPATAAAIAAAIAVLTAALVPLSLLARQDVLSNLSQVAPFLPLGAAGWLIARRQPRNPIGWLLLATTAGTVLSSVCSPYTWLVYQLGHHLPFGPVALLISMSYLSLYVTLPPVILLFPDGKLGSPRWRWVLRAYLVAVAALVVSVYAVVLCVIFAHRIRFDASGGLTAIDSPAGGTAWLSVVLHLSFPVLIAFWLVFAGRVVVSWRRADGERRQQLKWLLSGSAVSLISGIIGVLSGVFDPHASAAVQAITGFINEAGFIALAIGLGIAILKYRLYEIDRIISRTLSYAIVTGLLVGMYAGLVLLATHVLSVKSPVAVAVATLAAAALFSSVRRRVQQAVDRRFNRARYDADRTVTAFAARLQDAVGLDGLRSDLIATVNQALEPAHVSIWISNAASRTLPAASRTGPVAASGDEAETMPP